MKNLTTMQRLQITADRMTGSITPHVATGYPDGWRVTWLGDWTVDYNQAITAMMIANLASSIAEDEIQGRAVARDDERRLSINDLARELDMPGAEAERLATPSPERHAEDEKRAAVRQLANCPPWCHERHETTDDDTHYGPSLDVAGRTTTADYPYMLMLQREIGDETEIVLMTTASRRMNEPRDRAFSIDQARHLYAALGELLATVEGEQP